MLIANYRDAAAGARSAFYSLPPCRIIDTRWPAGPNGAPALSANANRTFPVAVKCGIPATVKAVSVNVTVTQPSAAGNFRLFPSGVSMPGTAVSNFRAGETRANNALVMMNASGQLVIRDDQPSGGAHFILDVNGYFQ